MRIKKFISAAAAGTILLSGASCGDHTVVNEKNDQTVISFSWWGNDGRHDYTLEAISKFEELHPEIKVNCNYSEWSGYQARYNLQMASHTESDVMQINYAWLNQFSIDGSGYYDINKLSDRIDLSNFTDEDLEYGMQNGSLNAIPIALNTQTVFINKTIYNSYGLDVPKTWDDFVHAAEVMNGEHFPLAMSQKSAFFFCAAMAGQATGKDLIDNDGKLLFNKNDLKIMMDYYCDMIEKKIIPQVEYFDKLEIASGVYAGAMVWVSDAESYCGKAIENGFDIVITDYTTLNGELSSWYAKPATMYAIRKDTQHPEEAAMLLDYLLNSTEMAGYQKIEKGTPLSSNARKYLEKNDLLGGIQYDAFNKMADSREELSIISPYFENDDMINAFSDICNEVIFGKADSAEQAEILYQQLREITDDIK